MEVLRGRASHQVEQAAQRARLQQRPLQRWTGRREHCQQTALAIAALVADRAAVR